MNNINTYISEKLKINKDVNDNHTIFYNKVDNWCKNNLHDYELEDYDSNKEIAEFYLHLTIKNKSHRELHEISKKISNEIFYKKEGDIVTFLDESTGKILIFNH